VKPLLNANARTTSTASCRSFKGDDHQCFPWPLVFIPSPVVSCFESYQDSYGSHGFQDLSVYDIVPLSCLFLFVMNTFPPYATHIIPSCNHPTLDSRYSVLAREIIQPLRRSQTPQRCHDTYYNRDTQSASPAVSYQRNQVVSTITMVLN
jgi:hypothetical protein